MADVVGARVKCPECGANSDALGDVLKCSYCGTTSRIQRRTQFGLKVPLAPPLPSSPVPVAVEQVPKTTRTAAYVVGVLILMFVVHGISVFAQYLSKPAPVVAITPVPAPPAPPTPPAPAVNILEWENWRPLVVDFDGDGTSDAIGFLHDKLTDSIYLVGISGTTAKVVWRTRSLGAQQPVYRRELYLAGDTVVIADHDKIIPLDSYDVKTGNGKFNVGFDEVIANVCDVGNPNAVKVITKDSIEWALDLTTGQKKQMPATGRKYPPCKKLPSSDLQSWEMTDFTMKHSRNPPGMDNKRLAGHEAPWIIIGVKSPGSEVPMLAAFDDRDKTLWTTTVPKDDPMSVKFEEPKATDVAGDLVATIYIRTEDQPPILTTFDRKTGTRKFEVPVISKTPRFVGKIDVVIGTKLIYVTVKDSLQAFDRDTGALKWVIGETG